MITFQSSIPAQAALAACGVLGMAAALLIDPHLVATHVSKDGVLEPSTLAALSILRPIGFAASLAVALAALFWPRLQKYFEVVVFMLPVLALISVIILKIHAGIGNPLYLRLIAEDGPIEYMTFLNFMLAACIAGLVGYSAFKSGIYVGATFQWCVSLFCLLVALEEISYGQRILGFQTPEYIAEVNMQKEFNLHNISSLQVITWYLSYSAILTFGLLGWLGRTAVTVLYPAAVQGASTANLLFPPWYVTSYFVPIAITWVQDAFTLIEEETLIIWQDQEPAELAMSFGFLIFVVAALRSCRQDSMIRGRQALAG